MQEHVDIRFNEDNFPEAQAFHTVDCTCHHCGKITRIPVPKSYIDYKKEADTWREHFLRTRTEITELMRYSELHYGMNPQLDMFMDQLDQIRKSIQD